VTKQMPQMVFLEDGRHWNDMVLGEPTEVRQGPLARGQRGKTRLLGHSQGLVEPKATLQRGLDDMMMKI